MAYYLAKEREEDVVAAYERYQNYVRENEARFPRGAFALATSEWWHWPHDHRCPHDGWLESVSVVEEGSGHRRESRVSSIRIRLLGAHHDGHIEIFYPRVVRYRLDSPSSGRSMGDWRYDEFTLSAEGNVIHTIEWAGFREEDNAVWTIEASDVEAIWIAQ